MKYSDLLLLFWWHTAPGNLSIGAEVAFDLQRSDRGLAAGNIFVISQESKVSNKGLKGTVLSPPEGSRCPVGLLELSPGQLQIDAQIPAAITFLDDSHRKRTGGDAREAHIATGDEVEFTLYTIPGTSYATANAVVVTRTRKDKKRAEKIAEMIASGQLVEEGIVESVNRSGDYGFVKCADRRDSLYFKLSEVTASEPVGEVSSSYYVITINFKFFDLLFRSMLWLWLCRALRFSFSCWTSLEAATIQRTIDCERCTCRPSPGALCSSK